MVFQKSEMSEKNNQPQANSLMTGCLLFISAGMNMAQGLGWNQNGGFATASTVHFRISWFIGCTAGAIMSAFLVRLLQKRILMAFCSLLVAVGGIIFTAVPFSYNGLLAARYLNGIASGMVTVIFLMHISEIGVKEHRGSYLGTEQYSIAAGMAIQIIYATQLRSFDIIPNRLHGILDLVFSVLALASLPWLIESPVFYLCSGEKSAAMEVLLKLKNPIASDEENQQLFSEHKHYVYSNGYMSVDESFRLGIVPLIKMVVYRSVIFSFTCSLPLNTVLILAQLINFVSWTPAVAACIRLVGALISVSIVDKLGRKLPSLISLAFIGVCMIVVAKDVSSLSYFTNSTRMWAVTSFCFAMQFFAGLYNPLISAYSGEAFPLRVCVVIEQIIQIAIISCNSTDLYTCLLTQGIILCIAFVAMCCTMPETKGTTLMEAQERFMTFVNFKLN